MSLDKESAIEAARADLAERLGVSVGDIRTKGVTERDFPDMSLGSPVDGEMSAQMIATGWQIDLEAKGKNFQYRGDKYQLRLSGHDGKNYRIR